MTIPSTIALLPHTTSCVLFFGFLVPAVGLVVLPRRVRRGPGPEARTQARLLFSTLVGGFGTVMRIKNGPNPNAAALFVNWFASRDGQEMWEREMLEVSMRTDVAHTAPPEYILPRPGVSYIDDYDPDYYVRQRMPAVARVQELFGR